MQITKHIHALRIPFQVPLTPERKLDRFAYVFPILGPALWLVDAAVAGSESALADYLAANGRRLDEVRTLVLTHSHPDHVGGATAVQRASGCTVAAHALERDWIEDVDRQATERPVPGFRALVGGSVALDRELSDGDRVPLFDGLTMAVLHTPGHSRGSISLHLPEERALICGDVVPRPGDLPIYEDVAAAVRSIRLLQAQPDVDVLLSSWDEPRRGGEAARTFDEALDWIQRLHDAVIQAAGDTATPDPMDLCRRVVAHVHLPPAAANPLVARTLQAHLRLREQRDVRG